MPDNERVSTLSYSEFIEISKVEKIEKNIMWEIILTVLWLGVLAGIDFRCMRVPVWLLIASGIFVTSMSLWKIWQGRIVDAGLFWSMLPGVVMLLVAIISQKAGVADGVVLLLMGISTDFRTCALSFVISLFVIGAVSLVLLVLKRAGKNTKLPYLPFLWLGYVTQVALANISIL